MGLVAKPGVSSAFERLFQHGGDINSAAAAFPEAPAPWIDLSTGINPVPYPLPALPPEAWTRLPSPAELMSLQTGAAARYGVSAECVVVAPGAQSLIQWLPRLFPARRVAIPGPTYSGHAAAWRAAGAEIVADPCGLAEASHIVVVDPNNPDGRRLSRESLAALAEQAAARRGLLVVDEAFADGEPASFAAERTAAVVLRSFGKIYGLAGLRLGFALARPDVAERLREALGAWPVSGAAIAVGRQALADDAWLAGARARLGEDARWLEERLTAAGFQIVGGAPLFRLAARADAAQAFVSLCAQGVLTRPFRAEPRWLRFGPPRPEDRARIAAALEALRRTL